MIDRQWKKKNCISLFDYFSLFLNRQMKISRTRLDCICSSPSVFSLFFLCPSHSRQLFISYFFLGPVLLWQFLSLLEKKKRRSLFFFLLLPSFSSSLPFIIWVSLKNIAESTLFVYHLKDHTALLYHLLWLLALCISLPLPLCFSILSSIEC